MKLTASRLKQMIAKELKLIKEGNDPFDRMMNDPDYRPVDDVPPGTPAHPPEPTVDHQAEQESKMKEDPSYREWFMSQTKSKPVPQPRYDQIDIDREEELKRMGYLE